MGRSKKIFENHIPTEEESERERKALERLRKNRIKQVENPYNSFEVIKPEKEKKKDETEMNAGFSYIEDYLKTLISSKKYKTITSETVKELKQHFQYFKTIKKNNHEY